MAPVASIVIDLRGAPGRRPPRRPPAARPWACPAHGQPPPQKARPDRAAGPRAARHPGLLPPAPVTPWMAWPPPSTSREPAETTQQTDQDTLRESERFARLTDRRARILGGPTVRAACGGHLRPARVATQGGAGRPPGPAQTGEVSARTSRHRSRHLFADPGQLADRARRHRPPAGDQIPHLAGLPVAKAAPGLRPRRLQPQAGPRGTEPLACHRRGGRSPCGGGRQVARTTATAVATSRCESPRSSARRR
jgi:hypothetical protein